MKKANYLIERISIREIQSHQDAITAQCVKHYASEPKIMSVNDLVENIIHKFAYVFVLIESPFADSAEGKNDDTSDLSLLIELE